MDAKLILIVAAVGVACFVLGLLVGGRRRDERMITQRSPLAPAAPQQEAGTSFAGPETGVVVPLDGANVGINLEMARELERLLAAGKKIEAIRIVRKRTGMGLKESKETVERLEGLMKRIRT